MIINFYNYWFLTRWKRIEHYLSKPSTVYFLFLIMLNKLFKIPYFKNYIKQLCLIKWISDFLILKPNKKIIESRLQGSNMNIKQLCFGF